MIHMKVKREGNRGKEESRRGEGIQKEKKAGVRERRRKLFVLTNFNRP